MIGVSECHVTVDPQAAHACSRSRRPADPGIVTMPSYVRGEARFPACSAVRGIDSLDHAEVVADSPVLG